MEGAPQPLESTATTIVGDHGTGIYFIAVFSGEQEATFRETLGTIAETVSFFVAVQEVSPEGSVSSDALAGRKITRFYTGSGYTETESIFLCASGAFCGALVGAVAHSVRSAGAT